MSMALAGLVILVIGDSHMAGVGANKGYLLTNLHDQLQAEGGRTFLWHVRCPGGRLGQ